jgi:hypothetical protein
VRFITALIISLKMRYENVSEKEPISADEGLRAHKTGASLKIIIKQYNKEQ